jgi:hypothetical protein
MSVNTTQFLSTVNDVMSYMANFSGGAVPNEGTEEYLQWMSYIQVKYEEASKRGFWKRLLTHDELALEAGDTEVYLPIRFQRPNSLYILSVDGIDLANPDRTPDGQSISIDMENDPESEEYGRWKIRFKLPISEDQDAPMWYFATPPKPVSGTDKIILPGDMVAYGALSEHFRSSRLEGSQDDARTEYENRMNGYLAMEMIPARHELLEFVTNPRRVDRLERGRAMFATRTDRLSRQF